MTTTLSTKGQIVIPNDIRARKNLRPGDELEILETTHGFEIRKKRRNAGLLRLLLDCPVKGEGLPPRRRKHYPRKVRF
jgi:AbrB family looped-hinge helix DNA binding protein